MNLDIDSIRLKVRTLALGRKIELDLREVKKVSSSKSCDFRIQSQENLTPARRSQFFFGRLAAKDVLLRLGCLEDHAVVVRCLNGAPHWPFGFCGSISHTQSLACAVAARESDYSSIGIDLESADRLSNHPKLVNRIATAVEQSVFLKTPFKQDRTVEPLDIEVLFSAKESVYKCVAPMVKKYFGFKSAKLVSYSNNQRMLFEMCPTLQVIGAPSLVEVRCTLSEGYYICLATPL